MLETSLLSLPDVAPLPWLSPRSAPVPPGQLRPSLETLVSERPSPELGSCDGAHQSLTCAWNREAYAFCSIFRVFLEEAPVEFECMLPESIMDVPVAERVKGESMFTWKTSEMGVMGRSLASLRLLRSDSALNCVLIEKCDLSFRWCADIPNALTRPNLSVLSTTPVVFARFMLAVRGGIDRGGVVIFACMSSGGLVSVCEALEVGLDDRLLVPGLTSSSSTDTVKPLVDGDAGYRCLDMLSCNGSTGEPRLDLDGARGKDEVAAVLVDLEVWESLDL